MFRDLFSKRYGLRATPEGLMYEDVPEPARVGLFHIVKKRFYASCEGSYKALGVALRIPSASAMGMATGTLQTGDSSSFVENLIMKSQWRKLGLDSLI